METSLPAHIPPDLAEFAENLHAVQGHVERARALALQGMGVQAIANAVSFSPRKIEFILNVECPSTDLSVAVRERLPEKATYLDVLRLVEMQRIAANKNVADKTQRARHELLDRVLDDLRSDTLTPTEVIKALQVVGLPKADTVGGLVGTPDSYRDTGIQKFVRDAQGNMILNPDYLAANQPSQSSGSGAFTIDINTILQVSKGIGQRPAVHVNEMSEIIGVATTSGVQTMQTATVTALRDASSNSRATNVMDITDIDAMLSELEQEAAPIP